jgi:hypothetical protein
MFPQDVTSNVFQEIGFLQSAADRATGINALTSGSVQPSNANRTAGGVNAQKEGTQLRLHTIVENIENFLIIPSVQKAIKMVRTHSNFRDQLPGQISSPDNKNDRQFVQVSSLAFTANTRVKVRAASTMLTRDRLSQLYQFVTQNVLNGQIVSSLAQKQETIDIDEMMTMLMDATGVGRRYKIIRPMNQQEMQRMQQQSQQQTQQKGAIDLQKAQMEQQTRLQMGQMKVQADQQGNQTQLQIAQMKTQDKGPSPEEIQMAQEKHQMDMQKIQADLESKAKELEFKKAESQLKIAATQAQSQQKLQHMSAEAQMKQMAMLQDHQHQQNQNQIDSQAAQSDLQFKQQSNNQNLGFQRENNALKQKMTQQKQKDAKAAAGKSKV